MSSLYSAARRESNLPGPTLSKRPVGDGVKRWTLLVILQRRANHLNRKEDAFESLTVVGGSRITRFVDIKMMLKIAFSGRLSRTVDLR
jgi:hypothetical protein